MPLIVVSFGYDDIIVSLNGVRFVYRIANVSQAVAIVKKTSPSTGSAYLNKYGTLVCTY